jgi:MFS transporter, DHA2 family, multidrug resistance protein
MPPLAEGRHECHAYANRTDSGSARIRSQGGEPMQTLQATMPSSSIAPRARATRREWLGLAVIALPCMLYAMDLTVLNLAIPTLSAALKPSSSELLWIIDVYGFMVSGFLVTMGTLGDRIGRRKLLLIGAACFGACSVLAAFAETAATLIATRALLGVAGATVAPSTLSLIRNMFHDERERGTAIGVWVASYSVGSAVGPLVGGLLLEKFWWGSVFIMAVPVMLLLLVCGPLLLPEYRDPAPGRIDLPSVALSLSSVLTFIFGLKRLAEHGVSVAALGAMLIGAGLGTLFILRQRRLEAPMVDLHLFRIPAFSASLIGYGLGCFAMMGVWISVGQYLQLVLGLSPLEAGLWTAPSPVVFIAASLVAPRLTRYVSVRVLMSGALWTAAIGFSLMTQLDGHDDIPLLVASLVLMSLGLSPLFTLGNDIIVGSAPPERAGTAAAISETSAELSGAVGIAVFGSLVTAIYQRGVARELAPDLLARSREELATLGGAMDLAKSLPSEDGVALLKTAHGAFLDAVHASAWGATALCALAAILLARVMRDGR